MIINNDENTQNKHSARGVNDELPKSKMRFSGNRDNQFDACFRNYAWLMLMRIEYKGKKLKKAVLKSRLQRILFYIDITYRHFSENSAPKEVLEAFQSLFKYFRYYPLIKNPKRHELAKNDLKAIANYYEIDLDSSRQVCISAVFRSKKIIANQDFASKVSACSLVH